MNSVVFHRRLNRLKDDVVRFQNAICAYETTDAARYPENFEKLGLDLAMRVEAIACSTRNIASIFSADSRKRLLRTVSEAQGIAVCQNQYGYEIRIPYLMTKRSSRKNAVFLLEPLSFALEEFAAKHPIRRLEHALVWYIYEYAEGTPARHIRDYDNIEAKEVLDVINAFFLLDDGGAFCELHYSTRRGKRDCTRVIISPDICLFSCPNPEGF